MTIFEVNGFTNEMTHKTVTDKVRRRVTFISFTE